MPTTMSTVPDPHTVLIALADHIKTHPELADTVTSVSPGRADFHIFPVDRPGPRRMLTVLAEWIGSLYDVAPAVVTAVPDEVERTHLKLYCQLHDGTAVTLIVVLKGDDHEVLVSSVLEELRVGDVVPVAHLLALAEGWTAGEEPVTVIEPGEVLSVGEAEDQAVDALIEPAVAEPAAEDAP